MRKSAPFSGGRRECAARRAGHRNSPRRALQQRSFPSGSSKPCARTPHQLLRCLVERSARRRKAHRPHPADKALHSKSVRNEQYGHWPRVFPPSLLPLSGGTPAASPPNRSECHGLLPARYRSSGRRLRPESTRSPPAATRTTAQRPGCGCPHSADRSVPASIRTARDIRYSGGDSPNARHTADSPKRRPARLRRRGSSKSPEPRRTSKTQRSAGRWPQRAVQARADTSWRIAY